MPTTPDQCFALSIRKADRVISQIYNEHLSPYGLKVTQFAVLRALHFLGETSAKVIQEKLVMEQATVSRALKPLIRDNFIQIAEGLDKREKIISLTSEGEALFKEASHPWALAQTQIRDTLGTKFEQDILALSAQIITLKN